MEQLFLGDKSNKFKMAKAKVSELKRYLSFKEPQGLRDEILELFKLFPDVREYYSAKLNPGSETELLGKYKKIVRNEFFPERGFPRMRYSIAKKAISDFKRISRNPGDIADLMLVYVEAGVDCTMEYGDIDENFYYSMETMYEKAAAHISKNNLRKEFQERCKKVMLRPQGAVGWGFSESLSETYYEYFAP